MKARARRAAQGERGKKTVRRATKAPADRELLRILSEFSSECVSWRDPRGKLRYISPHCQELCGHTAAEILRQPELMLQAVHPDDRARWQDHEQQAFAQRKVEAVDFRIVDTQGKVKWISHMCRPVYDAAGRFQGICGSNRDITARYAAEAALRRRDAILQAVSFAAQEFLRAGGWETDMYAVWERLGQAADVSRVYIYERHFAPDGRALMSQRAEWTGPGARDTVGDPRLQNVPFRELGLHNWEERLERHEAIQGLIREMPAAERAFYGVQDVLSIVVVPIFVDDRLWGCLGFDECRAERTWDTAEVEALRTAAGLISAAIVRQRIRDERERLFGELQQALCDVKTLGGLLPICSSCKKIRNDRGYWEQIEVYIRQHSAAEFSHGLCPDCVRTLYPELADGLAAPP